MGGQELNCYLLLPVTGILVLGGIGQGGRR